MAEIFKVNIEFRIGRGFTFPEHIRIPLNSVIEWNVIDMSVNQSSRRFQQSGLKFQLYFPEKSPFNWTTQSVNFKYQRPSTGSGGGRSAIEFQMEPQLQPLASGEPLEKGDFKYGIEVSEIGASESLYDADPWLHVF
jgi:hypothetical protein